MKTLIALATGTLLLALATPALAAAQPPAFVASCPTNIDVTSNGKGKVHIKGHKAGVKAFDDTAWEARSAGITVDISTDSNGKGLIVNYSVKGGGNGICNVTSSGAAAGSSTGTGKNRAPLNGVPPGDQQACLAAVSGKTNNGTVKILDATTSEANNTVIVGVGKQKAKWRCLVKNGKAADVMSLTSEGAL